MTLKEIKNLPDEFDFMSKINSSAIYHAKRVNKNHYMVSWQLTWTNELIPHTHTAFYKVSEFRQYLRNNEFVPIIKEIKL